MGPITFELDRQEPARPQSELLRIKMSREIAAATVLPRPAFATIDDPLLDLGCVYIKGDAQVRELIAIAVPIAGQRRASEDIARIWMVRRCLLRSHLDTN